MKYGFAGVLIAVSAAMLPVNASGQLQSSGSTAVDLTRPAGEAMAPASIRSPSPAMAVSDQMLASCAAAKARFQQSYSVRTATKTKAQADALTLVLQQCSYSHEETEWAVTQATGQSQSSAANDCQKTNSSSSATVYRGESCEALEARELFAAAKIAAQQAAATGSPSPAANPGLSFDARFFAALANGSYLSPPAESAWDLLRLRESGLSERQRRARADLFESEAQRCFTEAMNVHPERIGAAKTCLEAIAAVNPGWKNMKRDRYRLAVAIDPIGTRIDGSGVDDVLRGTAVRQSAVSENFSPRVEARPADFVGIVTPEAASPAYRPAPLQVTDETTPEQRLASGGNSQSEVINPFPVTARPVDYMGTTTPEPIPSPAVRPRC